MTKYKIDLSIARHADKNIIDARQVVGACLCANELFPSTGDLGHLATVAFGDRGTAGVLQIEIGHTNGNKKLNSIAEGIERRKRVSVGGHAP